MESFLLEVVAKVVVLCGTDVDVSHYQGVLPRVYELPQMLSQLGEGLSPGLLLRIWLKQGKEKG